MTQATPVVVFDFDLTLTRWDTADRFFRWLLRRDPWRLALVLLALPLLGPLFLLRPTRKWPIRFAVWVATLGRDAARLERLVEVHADELVAAGEPVFAEAAVARLHEHLGQGHRVVIATGSLEPLARRLLQRAGLAQVPLVASTLRPFLGGMVRDRHCFGPDKIPMLTARGFAPPWDIAYTDHRCDLPVLRLSRQWFLVTPTPRCLARIQEEMATRATVLAWR